MQLENDAMNESNDGDKNIYARALSDNRAKREKETHTNSSFGRTYIRHTN